MANTNASLILTGASGWFGRNALAEYERLYGPHALRQNVVPITSSPKLIDIGSKFGPIQSYGFHDIHSIPSIAGIIHLAFLTREYSQLMHPDEYIRLNSYITNSVSQLINQHPNAPIITISSGAVARYQSNPPSLKSDPYAALKLEEERLWLQHSTNRMSYVFRVYAATGRFIKRSNLFALTDFLMCAIQKQTIHLRSRHHVIRSYVHAGSMMTLFWSILNKPLDNGYYQTNAVTHTYSILDLANIISNIWDLPSPIAHIDKSLPVDDYSEDSTEFYELLNTYHIQYPNVERQLRETAAYLSQLKLD